MGNSRRHRRRASARRARHHREPDLLDEVRAALATGDPVDLLTLASHVVELGTRRRAQPFADRNGVPELSTLAPTFIDVRVPETTALLEVLAVLTPDQELAAQMRSELARRPVSGPAWLRALDDVEVVDAWSITDEFGDGENLLLTAQLPSGEVFMAGLLVQYTEGAAATDGFVGPGVARDLVVHTMRETNEDVDAARIEFADARARVEDAIVAGERMLPPFETETWPGCRSAIEWLLRSMPPDGKGYDWHEWTESERDALAMAFLESPWGQTFRDDDVARALVDAMLWFGCGYAPADPFRWSPQKIAIFFEDWVPRKLMIPADEIARLPSVVRRFVQYVHARSEIPERLTTVTLNAIEECTGEGFTSDDVHTSFVAWQTDQFALEVGGHDVLERLDTKPLPDEPFDWSSVPGDLQARVTTLLELIDGACAEFFDVECRTAARRLLARVVAGNPDVLRRRARDEITAACVVWLVGRGNDRFDQRVQVKEMLAWFGIPNAALSQRGRVIADAAGVPLAEYGYPLGDVALLDSGHRAWILERQERIAKMEW